LGCGDDVGARVVGCDGDFVGALLLGEYVGRVDAGDLVGERVGVLVGARLGEREGCFDNGDLLGERVGTLVTIMGD